MIESANVTRMAVVWCKTILPGTPLVVHNMEFKSPTCALDVNMANSQGTQAHDLQMLDDCAGTTGIMPVVSVALNCCGCSDMMTGKPRR
jgi:hypothetical protein